MENKNTGATRKNKVHRDRSIGILVFTLIFLAEVFALINPNFISTYNITSICQSVAPYAILSLGAVFPIALGCTDLSSGAVLIGACVVAGKLYSIGMPLFLCIPVMILFGALIGFLNGLMVSKLKLSPFIVTLGMMMFVRGISALFANQPNILFPTNSWYNRLFSTVNDIPIGFVWVIVFGIFTAWFFRKSKTGRHILAIGSSEKASVVAGLDAAKLKAVAFTISGAMAGVAAILWSASFATISVATGNGMELDAIAGAYIGGSSTAGGSVNTIGAIIGALLLVVLRSGLNFVLAKINIPLNSTYVTYVITGIIVVFAVFIDKRKTIHNQRNTVETTKTKQNIIKTYVLPGVALLLAVVLFVSNIFNAKRREDTKTLAVIMKSEGTAFWETVRMGAEDAARDAGYKLLIRGPKGEDASHLPEQRELLSLMLSEYPSGIGIAAIADGFVDLLEESYTRNIPVIQYDSGLYEEDRKTIEKSDKNPLRSYVQGNNYANGGILAEAVYEKLYNQISIRDSFTVGIIQHEDSVAAANRSDGFKDRFLELSDKNKATSGKCNVIVEVKPSDANNAYKEALEALYEKGVDMVYMTAEVTINQVYDAICASGSKYDDLYFAGYDSGAKALEWIHAEDKPPYICGVSQDPYTLGYLTVDTLIKINNNEKIEPLVTVPGVVYTPDNCDDLKEEYDTD